MTVTAAGLLAYHANWARQRREFLADEGALWATKGVDYTISDEAVTAPLLLRSLGERGYESVFISVSADTIEACGESDFQRIDRTRRLFPEAGVFLLYLGIDLSAGRRLIFAYPALDATSEFSRVLDDLRSGRW
jgi:hypothetical protein